jgi:hypothetical protein
MSRSTSSIAISIRSSPLCLRTSIRVGGSPATSITVGAVIQFCGLTADPPPSLHTMKVPSALIISRRSPIGSRVARRPA